jgi:hypothetical protein
MLSGGLIAALVGGAVLGALLLKGKGKPTKAAKPSGWRIGPTVNGRNLSVGMPASPTMQGTGWYFDFPPNGSVHAVQGFGVPVPTSLRYTVTGSGFTPTEYPDRPALVGLCLQRRGDDWSGKGKYQGYRWYHSLGPLRAGEFSVAVPLDPSAWADVQGQQGPGFAETLADLDNVALVFGHASGFAHGVSGSGRFTLA